jgi:iterative type I PKS product template protein
MNTNCLQGVYADMALTVADYIRRECRVQVPATGINVADMEILGPVTVPVPRVATPQLLRVNAVADLNNGTVELDFGTYSAQTKKTTSNAKCRVEYGNDNTWLQHWSRSAYLVQKRINDLERGVNEGTTDKMFKRMAYQLFSQLVVYGSKYQGMQEVLVNAEELEATATLKLYEGTDVGDFFASPLWIDNLAQLSGFVMNAIGVVDPRVGVYISHGWGSLQIAMPMDPTKPYKVHVKMQPLDGSMMAGNVSIFQDDTMVGLLGDVKFQKVPRPLLDTMLAPSSSRKPHATPIAEAPIVTKPRKIEPEMRSSPAPSRKRSSASEPPVTNILKVIAEEVGIEISDLTDESDLSEVGVDSLMSLTILSSIRESLHIELSSSVFSDCPTIGDLRRLLSSNTSTSDDESDFQIETPPESGVQTPEVVHEPTVGVKGDMLDILHTTIADEIGVRIEELLATDDLSALGVDSLMSLSIIAALRKKLNVDIPPNAIAESFSLQGIKEALNIALAQTLPVQEKTSTPRPNVEGAAKPLAKSMLLQGNPQTATKTIFLLPDGSGSATSYTELPTIASDACVLAINSPFLTCPEKYTCSFEEAAKLMVNEVRTRQPHGPYILAGWSAGGMYAYEAARQLLDAGESIDKLILIDSPCRLDYGPMPADVLEYVSRSGVIGGKGPTGAGAPKWLVEHFQATIRAIREYMPRPLGQGRSPPTFVVWAAKGVFEDWPRAELAGLDLSDAVAAWLLKPKTDPGSQGWEKLLDAGKMMCATVDGNHFSMVHPPNVSDWLSTFLMVYMSDF